MAEPVALAQSFIDGDGHDIKLYGIGDKVWAIRKPSPLNRGREPMSHPDQASGINGNIEQLPLEPEQAALARRCASLFGLDLYGVDCIETPNGLAVIEVNDFPNYTGVADASGLLADYVVRRTIEESEK